MRRLLANSDKLIYKDGRWGVMISDEGKFRSYSAIEVGQTYHCVIPANVAFVGTGMEMIKGTISNLTPDSAKATRSIGNTTLGFGNSAGPTYGNGLISATAEEQVFIQKNVACEFDITVSGIEIGSEVDKLYQYVQKEEEYYFVPFKLDE